MAATCPRGFNVHRLREQVRATYERVAAAPDGDFHFHRGAAYAVAFLGYDPDELGGLPARATARFAGVGNPFRIGPIVAGEVVLDHACGAGMDVLLAARRAGPEGRVIGVDMTPGMRTEATRAAAEAGLSHRIEIRAGLFEDLPVDDESVDVVLSNGVLNLAPDKIRVLQEIVRVLKPGGRLYLADVVVRRELTLEVRSDPELWSACVAGALPEDELTVLTEAVGLVAGSIRERFSCYRGTRAEQKVSVDLQVGSVNLFARRRGR